MNLSITNGDLSITPRELLAGIVAVVSLCGSLAFGYGVKVQQVEAVQTVVIRHEANLVSLTEEITKLRISVAELSATLNRGK
jgi:hypothetical protein